jgi:MoaA/NifB/PqqE/SkfB family radical SAM enzyme
MLSRFRNLFDSNILKLFKKALIMGWKQPGSIRFFARALWYQKEAAALRRKHLSAGTEVPPLLIVSVTSRCNLNCKGCYSKLLHDQDNVEMDTRRFREILCEAQELGVSIVMLAGGEPLIRKDLLNVAAEFPRIIFPVFTNGTLLDGQYLDFFSRHAHLLPIISLEGWKSDTDIRRGEGVWAKFQALRPELKARGLCWGVSFTLTSSGYAQQLSEPLLRDFLSDRCRLFFFVEYVPVDDSTKAQVLTAAQKNALDERVERLMKELPGIFIAFPGNEEQYGGCLAAGRGFLHINPAGYAEPCPFAPYTDVNVRDKGLRAALNSKLLRRIRENHHLLSEGEGGCALWANRDAVRQLISTVREG